MIFYDALKPINLETDASGIGLGASLLYVREGVNCGHDEVSDNVTAQLLLPVKPYPAQSASTTTLKGRHWVYCMGLKNFITTAFLRRYMISMTKMIGDLGQQRCCDIVILVAMYHAVHISVQCVHILQNWPELYIAVVPP